MQRSSAIFAVCGKQLAEPGAALAVLGELEDRRGDRQALLARGHRRDSLAHPDRVGQLDPAPVPDRRLVVEQVDLRRGARLEQVDHPLRPGREVRQTRQAAGPCPTASGRRRSAPDRVSPQQRAERDRSQAHPERARKCRRFSCWAILSSSMVVPSAHVASLRRSVQVDCHTSPICHAAMPTHSWVMVSSRFRITLAVAV